MAAMRVGLGWRAWSIAALAVATCAPGRALGQAAAPSILVRSLAARGTMPVRWPRRPLLDRATALARVPEAQARFGAAGAGATVCIVDTGIDATHRDFVDAAGRTRVRWLLDLARTPAEGADAMGARFGGALWSGTDLDADPITTRDRHGHGTAVAAVAAGDDAGVGAAQPGPMAGVAPEATIVAVQALRPGMTRFFDEDILRGVDFCFAVAGLGPSPTEAARTVAVLAFGGLDGVHDGSEPIGRALTERAEAGALIVAAAGNDGAQAVHAAGDLRAGERALVELPLPSVQATTATRYATVVVQTLTARPVSVALIAPDGTRTRFVQPGAQHSVDHGGGRLTVDGVRGARGPRVSAMYAVASGGADVPRPLRGGAYKLELRGPGRFDAYLVDWELGTTFLPPRLAGPFVDPAGVVSLPASAAGVIAVGAALSRTRLMTTVGELVQAGAEDATAPFSSLGPAWNGAPKPNLIAPGGLVITALSRGVADDDPGNMFGGDGFALALRRVGTDRIAMAGTSFSAPMVAGVLALALAQGPGAGARDRRLLAATARGEHAYDPRAGAGLLDAEGFLAARMAVPSGSPVAPVRSQASATRSAVRPGAHDLWLVVRGVGTDARPLATATVEVTLPTGATESHTLSDGLAVFPVPVPRVYFGEVLRYDVRIDGVELPPVAVRVHLDRARDGALRLGGGCRLGSRLPSAPWSIVLLLVLARRVAWRRRPLPRQSTEPGGAH